MVLALRILITGFFVLHIGYWVGILIHFEWVSYSSMIRPPSFIMLVFSTCGLYLVFPYGRKKRKRFFQRGMAIALLAFAVGAVLDFISRFRLVDTIENAEVLKYEHSYNPLTVGEKLILVAMLRDEPIKINLGTTLANMFIGYNNCLCGDGDGITTKWDGMLFSCKHGDELYIRGFLSFSSSRHIVWDI